MKDQPLQRSISPRELFQLCSHGPAPDLVDVRTEPEFLGAHVKGACSMPLHELEPGAVVRERGDRQGLLYVICQSGARAAKAIEQLAREGFRDCVLVAGGMDAWEAAGLPVERAETGVLPLQRQVHLIVGLSGIGGSLLALFADPWFALIPLVTGCGLTINGLTGWCGLGLILARMPWNRTQTCSVSGRCEGEAR